MPSAIDRALAERRKKNQQPAPQPPKGWGQVGGGLGANQTPVQSPPPQVKPPVVNPSPYQGIPPTDEFGGSPFKTYKDKLRAEIAPALTYESTAQRRLGYTPNYWQDPKAVVRYHNLIQSQPEGWVAPEWLDTELVETAYKYFEMRNNGNKDTDKWGYLNIDDPVLEYLGQVPPPPNDALMPHERAFAVPLPTAGGDSQTDWTQADFNWEMLTVEQKQAIVNDPNFHMQNVIAPGQQGLILSDPVFDLWGRAGYGNPFGPRDPAYGGNNPNQAGVNQNALPWWQPMAFTLLSNPKTQPLVQGAALTAMTKGKGWPLAVMITSLAYLSQSENEQVRNFSETLLKPFMVGAQVVEQAEGLANYLGAGSKRVGRAPYTPEELEVVKQRVGEFVSNPKEVWDAMKVFYETQTGDEVWVLGENEKVPVQPGYTLADAAKRAIQGGSGDEILADYTRVYGINGVASDFLLQSVYDPLNVIPNVSAEVRAKVAEGKAQSLINQGELTPEQAARVQVENIKANVYRSAPDMTGTLLPFSETSRLMQAELRQLSPDVAKYLTPWEQRIAGLTPDGKIKELLPDTPESKIPRAIRWTASLTQEAKAIISSRTMAENLMVLLDSSSPRDWVKILRSTANWDMGAVKEMGAQSLNNPEVYTSLGGIRDYIPKLQELVANYEVAGKNRDLFWEIQGLLGDPPEKLLNGFLGENPKLYFENMRQRLEALGTPDARALLERINSGQLTSDIISDLFKVFKDHKVPLHEQEFKARVMNSFYDHMQEWAVDTFHVEQAGKLEEVFRMMKHVQSMLLLDFSPSYAINNFVGNRIMMANSGVFGFTPESKMDRWIDEFGDKPMGYDQGYGPAGIVDETGSVISKSARGDAVVSKAADKLASVRKKIGISSKISSKVESLSSKQMYYSTMKEYYGRNWQAGKGFSKMPPQLEQKLRDYGVDPEVWYRNIEGVLSTKDFEKLKKGATTQEIHQYINGAAQSLGKDPADITAMLSKLGVLDEMRERLSNATTPAAKQRVYDSIEEKIFNRADMHMAQELEARAEHIANKITAEGEAGAIEIFQDMELDSLDRKIDNDRIWDDAYARIENATDYSLINQELARAAQENSSAWRRTQAHEAATYKGVINGLGLENEFGRKLLTNKVKQNSILADFFTKKNKAYDKFFRTIFNDFSERQLARNALDEQFNKLFSDAEAKVLKLQADNDALFVKAFGEKYGVRAEAMARAWRENIQKIANEMHLVVTAFRETLVGKTYAQRREAWEAFKPEYRKMWMEKTKANLDGVAQLYKWDDNPATVASALERGKQELQNRETVDAENESALDALLAENNITYGAKSDIVHLVNKYGGEKGAGIRRYADITPEVLQTAITARNNKPRIPFDDQVLNDAMDSLNTPDGANKAKIAGQALPDGGVDALSEVDSSLKTVSSPEEATPFQQVLSKVQNTLIPDMDKNMRDALMYELSVMRDLVATGEAGRKIFRDGKFSHAVGSTYPDWYGPLKKSKADVLFALEAMSKGLDKDQGLYRNLKAIAVNLLRFDSALLEKFEWADVFGMGDEVAYQWERKVRELERELGTRDIRNPADLQFIRQAVSDAVDAIGALPEQLQDGLTSAGDESNLDFAQRVFDEANKKLEAAEDIQVVNGALAGADESIKAQNLHADTVLTQESFRDQLAEVFRLSEDEADTITKLTDARARAWSNMQKGRTIEEWYATRLKGIVREGEPDLLQTPEPKKYYDQTPKGGVSFLDDGRAIIHAFASADISTAVHELAHIFRRDLVPEDLQVAQEWAGAHDGNWTRQAEEKFARGFERYLAEGVAPSSQLLVVFQKLSKWLLQIYKQITGSQIDVNITPEMRAVFDRMLGVDNMRVDMETLLRQMNYDPKRFYIDNNGEILERPQFDIKVNREAIDEMVSGMDLTEFQARLQDIRAKNPRIDPNIKHARLIDYPNTRYQGDAPVDMTAVQALSDWTQQAGQSAFPSADSVAGLADDVPPEMLFQQGRQTDTKAFRNWFGNSKVVDEQGQPLVVYHGTGSNFETFDPNSFSVDAGIFFTSDRSTAEIYTPSYWGSSKNPNEIKSVYLSIQNPYRINNLQETSSLPYVEFNNKADRGFITKETIIELQNKGYDGIIIGNDEYVAFSPTQIKSVENRGTFDPKNPNVLYQTAEPREPLLPPGGYEQTSGYMDMGKMLLDGYADQVRPVLDAMRNATAEPDRNYSFEGFDDVTQKELNQYLNSVRGEQATLKRATMRWGDANRNFALLDYQRQYGFDKLFSAVVPYEFYGTRSIANNFARILDRPAWIAHYLRLMNLRNTYQSQLPERLRNKIFIPMPFLPEWAGGGAFIDPTYQLFPWTQFTQPLTAYTRDQNQLANSAVYILREWGEDGTITSQEAQDAIASMSGEDFENAMQEARLRQGENASTGADYFSMLFSPALYATLPYYLATGKKPTNSSWPSGQLPVTRFGQGMETAFKDTPLEWIGNAAGLLAKPEAFVREKLGLNEFGEWGDYYIERQLSNMVAEGLIDDKTAVQSMIEKRGQYYDDAVERVRLELMLKVPGLAPLYGAAHGASLDQIVGSMLPSLFPAGILPPGEMEFKGLKQEYGLAWDAYKNGNKQAISDFFDEHPEYQARLALRRDPQERLNQFLRSEIWDTYTSLSDTDRKQAVAFLGTEFGEFLGADGDVEFPVEQLALWARILGGIVPETPETMPVIEQPDVPQIDYYSPQVTAITDQYFQERKQFDGYYALQTAYYNLPPSQRGEYLLRFPQLQEYFNWRKKWYKQFPDLIPIFNGEVFRRIDTTNWSPIILQMVQVSALTGDRLPEGAQAALTQVWLREGQPYGDFETWIYNQVYPSVLNEIMQGMVQ